MHVEINLYHISFFQYNIYILYLAIVFFQNLEGLLSHDCVKTFSKKTKKWILGCGEHTPTTIQPFFYFGFVFLYETILFCYSRVKSELNVSGKRDRYRDYEYKQGEDKMDG